MLYVSCDVCINQMKRNRAKKLKRGRLFSGITEEEIEKFKVRQCDVGTLRGITKSTGGVDFLS